MQETIDLGPRLLLVASFVPDQAKLGDIGTDHAYLPIFLWENKKIAQAIAVDVHEGPYQSAQAAIHSRGLDQWIDVRLGDGLKPIQPGEVEALTLAGMGGNTMLDIFSASPDVLAQVGTLVLQPQGAEGKVRKSLLDSGWLLQDEQLIAEEGRIYGVIVFSRFEGKRLKELSELKDQWLKRVYQRVNLQNKQVFKKEIQAAFERIFWKIGPLNLEYPVPELEQLFLDSVEPLRKAITEMKKSLKEEVQIKMHQQEIVCTLLEEMKKWLFPSD
ncbi:tRNA (adenine(22)-N(1))-methyltransferase [Desulfitobacterium sp. AusDCA]|uniref:tRNA (adenine(22)-N(1))-methyltransferase n=1 Tax=Desulfitobacterium sp. AusDCA TaxID=3240383 RepID=UPI003DA72B08